MMIDVSGPFPVQVVAFMAALARLTGRGDITDMLVMDLCAALSYSGRRVAVWS